MRPFDSIILTFPGIGGSGPQHWQSLWEKEYGFIRVEQQEWETPVCSDWVNTLNEYVGKYDPANIIIVAHSAACIAMVQWAQKFAPKIKAALLVAPADAEATTFPIGAVGFGPIPMQKLPFPSIVVTSSNDHYVTIERAQQFAQAWGSGFVNIGEAGHINVASGFGEWEQGLELLKKLDSQ